jgi:hypothetical protein
MSNENIEISKFKIGEATSKEQDIKLFFDNPKITNQETFGLSQFEKYLDDDLQSSENSLSV